MPAEALADLLPAGPLPPRAAIELAMKLVDAMNGQPPVGDDALQASRVKLANGVATIDRRGARPADEAETRKALGLLMYHALTGVPWKPKDSAKGQLEELRGQLSFWPDGAHIAELVEELITADGGFSGVRSRLDGASKRAAGTDLSEWQVEAKLRLAGELEQAAPRVPSVDDLTANIPMGALARGAAAPAPDAPVLTVTPPSAPDRAGLTEAPPRSAVPLVVGAAALAFLVLLVVLVIVLAILAF